MNATTVRELSALIRHERREKGLSQTALAALAGVGRDWIIELEKGKSTVELGLVMRTLKALGLGVQLSPLPGKPSGKGAIDLGDILNGRKKGQAP